MKTGHPPVDAVLAQLAGIIAKQARLHALPIRYGEGLVLTPREMHLIQAIGEDEGLNINDLAARFQVTKSAVSQLVSKLVSRGFVDKHKAAHSNKEVSLLLSASGRDAYEIHAAIHREHGREMARQLAGYADDDLANVALVLADIDAVLAGRLEHFLKE